MRIGPLRPLIERIRDEAASLERRPGRGTPESSLKTASAFSDAYDVQPLLAGIAAIPLDAPDRRRRAFRVFLQATLVRELRLGAPGSTAAQELVDSVLETMEESHELRAAMEHATDVLIRRFPPST